jgi:hypothetical protein
MQVGFVERLAMTSEIEYVVAEVLEGASNNLEDPKIYSNPSRKTMNYTICS